MSHTRWVTFGSYCSMNFLIGMHYYSIYPNIVSLESFLEDFRSHNFKFIYPLLYVILGPFSYRYIWKSFYWAKWFAWSCILTSIWLKYFSIKSETLGFIGQTALVASTSLVLPGNGVLAVKNFKEHEYFFVLTWASTSHVIGIIAATLSSMYFSPTDIYFAQGLFGILVAVSFLVFSENEPLVGTGEYASFVESLKILFKKHDNGILFLTISAQIALVYCCSVDLPTLLRRNPDNSSNVVKGYLFIFLVCTGIGGYLSIVMLRRSISFGVLARMYIGIPFIIIFLLNHVFKNEIFICVLVIALGLTVIPTIPYLQLIGLSIHKKTLQPISINLSYYFAAIFMSLFLITSRVIFQTVKIHAEVTYNVIQFLILVCFLTVYNHHLSRQYFTKPKVKHR